jgi:hypothetical protein
MEFVNLIALISWLTGFLIGYFITAGIPALNALFASAFCYFILSKIYVMVMGEEKAKFFLKTYAIDEQPEEEERSLA